MQKNAAHLHALTVFSAKEREREEDGVREYWQEGSCSKHGKQSLAVTPCVGRGFCFGLQECRKVMQKVEAFRCP